MHLFLSPHLDDAVLSCGGTIHQLVTQGHPVTVLTTMAGDPPVDLPRTPITEDLHQRWQAGEHPGATRRAEDAHALASLGAQAMHLTLEDCVYRVVTDIALYPTEESLWSEIHPQDYAFTTLHQLELPPATTVYVPLGVGQHVDHRIVRDWGLALNAGQRVFYEEYPYINDKIEVERALRYYADQPMQLEVRPLHPADVQAKVRAIACYTSQISTFWEDTAAMEAATIAALVAAGDGIPAERFWHMAE